jgi:hypothetical protein
MMVTMLGSEYGARDVYGGSIMGADAPAAVDVSNWKAADWFKYGMDYGFKALDNLMSSQSDAVKAIQQANYEQAKQKQMMQFALYAGAGVIVLTAVVLIAKRKRRR